MPREPAEEMRERLARIDPLRALGQDPLAARLLELPDADPRAGAMASIRARDPRARLEAAAARLHGPRLPPLPEAAAEPAEQPPRPRARWA